MQVDPREPERRASTQAFGRYAVGLQFAGTVGLFVVLGWWADRKLGTTPWLLLAGALLGIVGSFISLISKVKALDSTRSPPRPPRSP